MLLSHDEIEDLLDQNVVEYSDIELINSASLDLRLGRKLLIERPIPANKYTEGVLNRVVLKDRTALKMVAWDLVDEGPFVLYPGEFILASSHEVFNLPADISSEYKLKSSMARIGLEHLNAGWCDAGWNGSVLTLELKNMTRHHEIVLHYLDKIGQMVFFRHRHVKSEHSYATKGRYNGHKSVMGAQPDIISSSLRTIVIEDETEIGAEES